MKLSIRFIILLGLMFILTSVLVFAAGDSEPADDTTAEIRTAAEKELKNFQGMISERYWNYDFKNAEEVRSTSLGDGFQVWGVDFEKLENSTSTNLSDVIKPLNQWSFVVSLDGVPKTMITIGIQNDKYSLISGGGDAPDIHSAAYTMSKDSSSKLVRINDVDLFVSNGPTGEVKQSLNKNVVISDNFVNELRMKQQYNENGELLYGASPL